MLDEAYPVAFKLDTKKHELKFKTNLDKSAMWDLVCHSDSYHAGDFDSKRNVGAEFFTPDMFILVGGAMLKEVSHFQALKWNL